VKGLQNDLKAMSKEKKGLLEEVAAAEAERCAKTEAKVAYHYYCFTMLHSIPCHHPVIQIVRCGSS
jgi:hypothetical protein